MQVHIKKISPCLYSLYLLAIRMIMKKSLFVFVFILIYRCISAQSYTNPILSGFYPDPSICKKGDDYYIVTSSFAYFPGLPIFHSKDLVSWHQIGYAMDRKEQLDLTGAGVSRGLFAPTIRYYNNKFYIVCTLVDKGGNFIISADDAKGPWTNPVFIPEVNGIDPSIYVDDDGKAYIMYNSIPPDNKSLYNGHRTIRMYEFDLTNLKVTGSEKLLINGGVDISKNPVWIEAPHVLKKDGWYYLYCAEGGTGYNHSEVVFRSKSIEGPYIPYDKNPILTQRHLDKTRPNPVTTTGHADFIETNEGEWYAIFLGCRPYEEDHYNTGRETFMTPLKWIDGWPVINPDHAEVQSSYPFPKVNTNTTFTTRINEFASNQKFFDHFDDSVLNNRYTFLRTPVKKWYTIKNGMLDMELLPDSIQGKTNVAMVADRQNNMNGMVSTRMLFQTMQENEKAGLIVFQNENHYYYMCKSAKNGRPVVELYKGPGKNSIQAGPILLNSIPLKKKNSAILFKITVDEKGYSFYYAHKKDKWLLLRSSMDRRFLSTATAGGFVGCMYGMYATSNGKPSVNTVRYDWFEKE